MILDVNNDFVIEIRGQSLFSTMEIRPRLRYRNIEDLETSHAFFKTKVPAVASEAYLSIIFKPASPSLVAEVSKRLKLPMSVSDFYRQFNGAHLFVNALSILGCVPKGTPLDRSDRFSLPPFDIIEVNNELRTRLAGTNLVCLASYGFDQSLVCIERSTAEMICFVGENTSKERVRWPSFDEWLSTEVKRISFLFDEDANRLVEKEKLLPFLPRIN